MGLCVYKLADKNTPPEQQAVYWGGLSGILGCWFPSPMQGREEKDLTLTTKESEGGFEASASTDK